MPGDIMSVAPKDISLTDCPLLEEDLLKFNQPALTRESLLVTGDSGHCVYSSGPEHSSFLTPGSASSPSLFLLSGGQHLCLEPRRTSHNSSRRPLSSPLPYSTASLSPRASGFRLRSHLLVGALLCVLSLASTSEGLATAAVEGVLKDTGVLKPATADSGEESPSVPGHPGVYLLPEKLTATAEATRPVNLPEPEPAPWSLPQASDVQPSTLASDDEHTGRGRGCHLEGGAPAAATDPFSPGPYDVLPFNIPQAPNESGSAPQPLLVFAPMAKADMAAGNVAAQLMHGPTPERASDGAARAADSGAGETESAVRETERTVGETAGAPHDAKGGLSETGGKGSHAGSQREGVSGGADGGQGIMVGTNTSAPVVVFLHGFNLKARFYSQLLTHIASHGFIVVAPQLYSFSANPDASREIIAAGAVLLWLKTNLGSQLPDKAGLLPPDTSRLCIAGHSRGGKEAYGVALGLSGLSLAVQAVLVLDPVDGTSNTSQTPPPILQHKPDSLHLGAPALVVGTGLGALGKLGVLPACAPAWVGHQFFYSDTAAPAYHVRATEFGHMDLLDDETGGLAGKVTYVVCRNGRARAPMRKFCGGVSVAFLKGVLGDELPAFENLFRSAENFPIKVDSLESKSGATRDSEGHVAGKSVPTQSGLMEPKKEKLVSAQW